MVLELRVSDRLCFVVNNALQKKMFAISHIFLLLTQSLASPVWMPQFLSGGTGRNIRHLPCVSRRTGEQGTCMFAYTCMKANGTHLGTCIDRFYFGSCCKLNGDLDLENDLNYPIINGNNVSGGENDILPPISTAGKVENVSTISGSTTMTTEKIYVPIATSSSTLNKTESGIFGDILKKPVTPMPSSLAPISTTTQQYFLSTFQVVHDNNEATTSTPITLQTTSRITIKATEAPNKNWTTISPSSNKRPTTTVSHSAKPLTTPKPTTTTKRTTKPTKQTTRKPPTKKPTQKPTQKPTSRPSTSGSVIKATTTSKPSVSTKKTTTTTKKPTSSTISHGPVSTITTKPVTTGNPTKKPSSTAKPSSSSIGPVTTTSEVVFTKPGSPLASNATFPEFSTFRPDLSSTTNKPVLITGPGLTTFSYVSDKVTIQPSTNVVNDISTAKVTTPSNVIEIVEEQSNVIFQQAGTQPPTSSTAVETSTVPFFPENSKANVTKEPWIEITQDFSSTESTSSSTFNSTPTSDSTTTPSSKPSFGSLNMSDFTQVCGRRLYPESRVVGGEKSSFGKWPWQISLRQWRTSTYLHKCGAALLNENWAITAAHCVENVPPSDLLLRLGEHDLSTEEEPYGYQERRVQIVASHPRFDARTFEYDLALLRFYEPVKFQPNIIPVCVPEDTTNFVGQTAHVTGWGRLYEDGPLPSVLQEVSVPVINNTLCENMYRAAGYIEHIPEIFICAGWKKGGFDSCEGDSGGPMVIQRPDKRWLLAGVISWGIGCAEPNQPGVYTRISEFRDWINQILQF